MGEAEYPNRSEKEFTARDKVTAVLAGYGWGGMLPGVGVLLVLMAIGGCQKSESQSNAAAPKVPPEVGVVTVTPQRVELATELPGRTAAVPGRGDSAAGERHRAQAAVHRRSGGSAGPAALPDRFGPIPGRL